jgi:hypothetical protein
MSEIKKTEQTLELEITMKLAQSLNLERSRTQSTWKELGECLYQIHPSMLDVWINITNKGKVFTESECKDYWENEFKQNAMAMTEPMACLETWAKIDDYDGFQSLIRTYTIADIIKNGTDDINPDYIASLIFKLYKNQYRCTPKSKWYEFRYQRHRWFPIDNEEDLKRVFQLGIINEYLYTLIFCNTRATQLGQVEKDEHLKIAHRLSHLTDRLRNFEAFQPIMDRCKKLFKDYQFEALLDTNPRLNAYEHGIFDHDIGEFRSGRPCDYISQQYLL